MNEIVVQKAKYSDLNYFVASALEVKDLEESLGYRGYAQEGEFLSQYSKFLLLVFDDSNYTLLVAKCGQKTVGCLLGNVYMMEKFYDPNVIGVMSFIYVSPEERKREVARKLVVAFEDEMAERGIFSIAANIYAANGIPQKGLIERGYRPAHIQYFMRRKPK